MNEWKNIFCCQFPLKHGFASLFSTLINLCRQLTAPDGQQMYSQEKKTDDSYFFTAEQDGKYIFCLGNQKSSLVPKTVYFMFDFLNDEKRYRENDDGENKTGM